MEKKNTEEEKIFWDKFAGRYDGFMKRLSDVYSTLIDMIWSEIKQEDEVLEIGSGTGIISLEICRKAKKVYATDISEAMLKIASEKAEQSGIQNVEFRKLDGYQIPYGDQAFDVCIVANTLHVMKSPGLCLKEIKRVLKPEGLLIAPTFCHGETLKARIISRIMEIYGFKAYQKFTIESLADLIERSGFHILKKQPLESSIPMLYLLARPYGESANIKE